ncbi:MAG TPA: hypothetical protein VMG38_02600 [Trebonia sp.]|nr:hypothetical protein [Trebonia sp.]
MFLEIIVLPFITKREGRGALDKRLYIRSSWRVLAGDGRAPLMISVRAGGRRIMGENLTDGGLLDLSGIRLSESLDESALAAAVRRALASSEDGPSYSFSASI